MGETGPERTPEGKEIPGLFREPVSLVPFDMALRGEGKGLTKPICWIQPVRTSYKAAR